MKVVIQRVEKAKVEVQDRTVGEIGPGLLALVAIHLDDHLKQIAPLVEKMLHLRIFSDGEGKMNRSLLDVEGALLVVSQFTLYANCKSGRRPSFTDSAPPDRAKEMYETFVSFAKEKVEQVETGVFGAHMKVQLLNDGPVTMILEG